MEKYESLLFSPLQKTEKKKNAQYEEDRQYSSQQMAI